MMGVYEIINLLDGKMTSYVGSSVHVGRRWREHVGRLRKGKHFNKHLQRSWNKYGEGAFIFCLLETVELRDDLRDREQVYLDRLFEASDNPYNVGRDARKPMLGIIPSDETKKKMSIAGYNRPPKSEETRRKVGRWSKNWERPLSVGFKISKALIEKNASNASAKPVRNMPVKTGKWKTKPFPAFIHYETGDIIPAGKNLAKVCRERGLNVHVMYRVRDGDRRSHKGWVLLEGNEKR